MKETQAAAGRRKIWQGHDERDPGMVSEGARELYSAITGRDKINETVGEMIKDAFWLADEAEKYQGADTEMEDLFYNRATRLLKEARDRVGLEWHPMEYRGNGWWKAYRRGDEEKLEKYVQREHLADLGPEADYEEATKHILSAAEKHSRDDWDGVEQRLEDYYDVVLEELRN